MTPKINHSLKFFILVILGLLFVSCSAFNPVKGSAGDISDDQTGPAELSQLKIKTLALEQSQNDLQAQLSELSIFQSTLLEKIAELESQLEQLKKRKTNNKIVEYKVEYTTPQSLYQKARNLLLEDDYLNASKLFTDFIKNHPKDSLADNAVYWLGECHYSMGEFKKAINVFKDLENRYPKSEKVPDSLLKTGYSYISLDDTNRAHHYLKLVLKKYPFSPAAEKAQEKLGDFN